MYDIDHAEQMTLRMKELRPRVPSWAKAERMEITTSQSELWKYADDPKKKIRIHLLEMLTHSKSK